MNVLSYASKRAFCLLNRKGKIKFSFVFWDIQFQNETCFKYEYAILFNFNNNNNRKEEQCFAYLLLRR